MLDPFELIPSPPRPNSGPAMTYRSAAVARMLGMPVSTLRIWERRYRVISPMTTASGHRLYTAMDVQRLALLKQLTGVGHAIGSIAALEMTELRQVAATHVQSMNTAQPLPRTSVAWPIAVIGEGLLRRIQHPEVSRWLGRRIKVAMSFASTSEVVQESSKPCVEALLVQAAGLHLELLPELQTAVNVLGVRNVLVCYGYGTALAMSAFEAAGIVLLRSIPSDRDLARTLQNFMSKSSLTDKGAKLGSSDHMPGHEALHTATDEGSVHATDEAIPSGVQRAFATLLGWGPPAPSRYHPATLVDMASMSTALSCECPSHVAQLLTLLTDFETYSAECVELGSKDAEMHTYLQFTAGLARELFEAALERLAMHEGIVLPT